MDRSGVNCGESDSYHRDVLSYPVEISHLSHFKVILLGFVVLLVLSGSS